MGRDCTGEWDRAGMSDCLAVVGIPRCHETCDVLRVYRVQQLVYHSVRYVIVSGCEKIPYDDRDQTYH